MLHYQTRRFGPAQQAFKKCLAGLSTIATKADAGPLRVKVWRSRKTS